MASCVQDAIDNLQTLLRMYAFQKIEFTCITGSLDVILPQRQQMMIKK